MWVNTSSAEFRQAWQHDFLGKKGQLEKLCRQNGANYLAVRTDEDFVPPLVRLFKVRNLSNGSLK